MLPVVVRTEPPPLPMILHSGLACVELAPPRFYSFFSSPIFLFPLTSPPLSETQSLPAALSVYSLIFLHLAVLVLYHQPPPTEFNMCPPSIVLHDSLLSPNSISTPTPPSLLRSLLDAHNLLLPLNKVTKYSATCWTGLADYKANG